MHMRLSFLVAAILGLALLGAPAASYAAATATPINGAVPVSAAPAPAAGGTAAPVTAVPAPSAGSGKAAMASAAAKAKAGVKSTTQPSDQNAGGSMLSTLAWFAIPLGIVYLLILMPKSREDKRRRKMLSELKRGDRVVTTGGMIASVIDVRDSEVVLKVDESANVKARFTRAAIAAVLPDSSGAQPEEKAPEKKK
ncbi:MAG: preprotein translocase subunit YajC [Phycisphaerae bacterium]